MQKSEAHKDLRVLRTRKLIQQAFIDLTVEKGFAALTIQDITERAMINRSTFYRHYLDKYDLLDQLLNELDALLDNRNTPDEPGPLRLLQHIEQFADFYRVMLGPQGDPSFVERFRQNTERHFRALFAQARAASNEPPLDLKIASIAYAGVGATIWWLEQQQPCSPEQLATWMSQISSAIAGPELKPRSSKER
ncbi:TetR family transcriptional regulator [Thermosporothrix hazakensis]|jgi:AcrR family transcriptional regulator|uniref:TetR family transcriptional regulator n=2 Tax=Thermosporothrix TaxID=768650 RepID=A0A326U776_THEHA|nr:TetR/AcrR family transcriptional regulator [Thermosporothrix hazakensis]PZW28481.1 TetR family transcriptional regulator [Thermosporothrix hazakensis]BBH86330.1 TetR family transcriptional regulator [Thermosporothrix sp. COM3]GCE45256.1 TetR family transcriptional regulator [Thermosporothrix hazakensis]